MREQCVRVVGAEARRRSEREADGLVSKPEQQVWPPGGEAPPLTWVGLWGQVRLRSWNLGSHVDTLGLYLEASSTGLLHD